MAQKKYSDTLARRADRMILMHTEFLSRVSPSAARRLLADFKKVTGLIAENPFRFPFADEVDVADITPQTYRKCVFDGRYKALFIVEGDNVYIDAVIDCRQ